MAHKKQTSKGAEKFFGSLSEMELEKVDRLMADPSMDYFGSTYAIDYPTEKTGKSG